MRSQPRLLLALSTFVALLVGAYACGDGTFPQKVNFENQEAGASGFTEDSSVPPDAADGAAATDGGEAGATTDGGHGGDGGDAGSASDGTAPLDGGDGSVDGGGLDDGGLDGGALEDVLDLDALGALG